MTLRNWRAACCAALVLWLGAGCAEEPPPPAPSGDATPGDATPADAAPVEPAASSNGAGTESADTQVATQTTDGAAGAGGATGAGETAPPDVPAASPSQPPTALPTVAMSAAQRATVLVAMGDELPATALPDLQGATQDLSALYGTAATVVFFWRSDNPHSLAQLADCGPDVLDLYGSRGVAVIGISTGEPAAAAQAAAAPHGPAFPLLCDADGAYLAKLATAGPPRVFVLDAGGKIVWFDIEYSRATRESLDQALRFLVAQTGAVAGQ